MNSYQGLGTKLSGAKTSANCLKGRGRGYSARKKGAGMESLEPTLSWSCLDFETGWERVGWDLHMSACGEQEGHREGHH